MVGLGLGCKEGDSKSAPTSGRVNAVRATGPEKRADPAAFCDVWHARTGPALTLPELAEPVAPAPKSSWRWVNLWATWCEPCVEELPRLRAWTAKLGVELVLVSVDEDAAAVAAFADKHGSVAGSGRIADPEAVQPWLVSVGLDQGAPLPIHVLVDPAGAIRCLRAGAVAERDYASVAALVAD